MIDQKAMQQHDDVLRLVLAETVDSRAACVTERLLAVKAAGWLSFDNSRFTHPVSGSRFTIAGVVDYTNRLWPTLYPPAMLTEKNLKKS